MSRRLALAAPVMHLAIMTALLVLVSRPAQFIVPVLVALLVAPTATGFWVFRERPALSRVLLSTWAPAGGAVLFAAVVAAIRAVGEYSEAVLAALVVLPLAVLLVLSVRLLRGQDRATAVWAVTLWLLAAVVTVAAVPLAERLGGTGGMEALAGTVTLLFAPSVAFGAWAGLAIASRIPEPMPPGRQDDDGRADDSATTSAEGEVKQ